MGDAVAADMRTLELLALFAVACAARAPVQRAPETAAHASTESVNALVRGDYAAALANADRGLARDGDDPWLRYDRGVALAGLGRLDEALFELRRAEARFADAHDRSLATYRRALALELGGRCAEASTEYSHYAALVHDSDPTLANDALAHLRFCVSPAAEELARRAESTRLLVAEGDRARLEAERASTAAVEALTRGDYATALAQARSGLLASPRDPWLRYDEGTALAGLERLDEALAALRQAEALFSPGNLHGRSVATYRRAIALEIAGRCEEERAELDHYAALVGNTQPQLAQHNAAHLRFCEVANDHPTM